MSPRPVARVVPDPASATGTVHADDPDLDDLRYAVLARLRPTLADLDHIRCRLDRRGADVVVHLTGPPISDMRRHAIAVRVLDAVRSIGRTYGHVEVAYETPANGRHAQRPGG